MIFRPIRNTDELEAVYRLTHDAYVEMGYAPPRRDRRLTHYAHLDHIPETTVFVAEEEGRIIGTNSSTFDGPCGLHVDGDFKEVCDAIRQTEGRIIASSWRIVTNKDFHDQRRVVMGLIQATMDHAIANGCYTWVFTFNPRHERVYKRLLNMHTLALAKQTHGLNNAPAVLMRCRFEDIPKRWVKSPAVARLQAELKEHRVLRHEGESAYRQCASSQRLYAYEMEQNHRA